MCSRLSMDREILSKIPTLLRLKLQSKMAHFAALDSVYVYKTTKSIPHFIKPSFDTFEY